MKTIFEAGYHDDTISYTGGHADDGYNGAKYTVAQAFSAGKGFWARPEIRVYASYFDVGGKAWQGTAEQTPFNGGKDADTYNFGVQAEAWW